MIFHEDWFGPASQRVLASLVETTEKIPGRVVEVGSWEGRSTIALANAIAPDFVDAVDTWAGSPGEISADLAAHRDVFATFTANIAEATEGNVDAYRMGWRDYLAEDRSPVRFLFIDAEHTYEEVRDTIAGFLPLMAEGGIVCGDDVHHPPVRRAVLEAFGDACVDATLWWVRL